MLQPTMFISSSKLLFFLPFFLWVFGHRGHFWAQGGVNELVSTLFLRDDAADHFCVTSRALEEHPLITLSIFI